MGVEILLELVFRWCGEVEEVVVMEVEVEIDRGWKG